jgi:ketosteroid isomerase-like protein
MAMSNEIEMLREAYQALNRGEWERSPDFMHDEITWNFVEGAAPDAPQTLRGAPEIIDFWGFFFTAWEEWEMAPQDFVEAPGGEILASVHFHARGTGSGVPMDFDFWQVIRVRDGRIHRVDNYLTRARARRACGLG